MPEESGIGIGDLVVAQLIECQPEPALVAVPVPDPPDGASPTQRAAQATIGQTGADPPPAGRR